MSKKKGRAYIPPRRFNPAVIANQVDESKKKIEKMQVTFDHKYDALLNYLTLIVNFASHDIKNAVHNLDGVISTVSDLSITANDIDVMKMCIDNIRSTLDKFSEFNVTKDSKSFELSHLFNSISILHRPYLNSKNITLEVTYHDVDRKIDLKHDFQYILFMFNNLMINSITALENVTHPKKISVSIYRTASDALKVLFADNGCGINPEIRDKIFKPYFTTKPKGSGVGLTHARFVLTSVLGSIELLPESQPGFTTSFEIYLPLSCNET